MPLLRLAAGLGLCAAVALPVTARGQLSPAAKIEQVAANQLGLVEYCHVKGFVGADAVAAERAAFLGGPATQLSTVPAEDLGRRGFSVAPDSQQITFAALAALQHTSEAGLCKDLGESALQFQAAMHRPR